MSLKYCSPITTSFDEEFFSLLQVLRNGDDEKIVSNFEFNYDINLFDSVDKCMKFRAIISRMNDEKQSCFFDVVDEEYNAFVGCGGFVKINRIQRETQLVFVIFEKHKDKLPQIIADLMQCISISQFGLRNVICKLHSNADDAWIDELLTANMKFEAIGTEFNMLAGVEGKILRHVLFMEPTTPAEVDSTVPHCVVCHRGIKGKVFTVKTSEEESVHMCELCTIARRQAITSSNIPQDRIASAATIAHPVAAGDHKAAAEVTRLRSLSEDAGGGEGSPAVKHAVKVAVDNELRANIVASVPSLTAGAASPRQLALGLTVPQQPPQPPQGGQEPPQRSQRQKTGRRAYVGPQFHIPSSDGGSQSGAGGDDGRSIAGTSVSGGGGGKGGGASGGGAGGKPPHSIDAVCHYWQKGQCIYGSDCRFQHPQDSGGGGGGGNVYTASGTNDPTLAAQMQMMSLQPGTAMGPQGAVDLSGYVPVTTAGPSGALYYGYPPSTTGTTGTSMSGMGGMGGMGGMTPAALWAMQQQQAEQYRQQQLQYQQQLYAYAQMQQQMAQAQQQQQQQNQQPQQMSPMQAVAMTPYTEVPMTQPQTDTPEAVSSAPSTATDDGAMVRGVPPVPHPTPDTPHESDREQIAPGLDSISDAPLQQLPQQQQAQQPQREDDQQDYPQEGPPPAYNPASTESAAATSTPPLSQHLEQQCDFLDLVNTAYPQWLMRLQYYTYEQQMSDVVVPVAQSFTADMINAILQYRAMTNQVGFPNMTQFLAAVGLDTSGDSEAAILSLNSKLSIQYKQLKAQLLNMHGTGNIIGSGSIGGGGGIAVTATPAVSQMAARPLIAPVPSPAGNIGYQIPSTAPMPTTQSAAFYYGTYYANPPVPSGYESQMTGVPSGVNDDGGNRYYRSNNNSNRSSPKTGGSSVGGGGRKERRSRGGGTGGGGGTNGDNVVNVYSNLPYPCEYDAQGFPVNANIGTQADRMPLDRRSPSAATAAIQIPGVPYGSRGPSPRPPGRSGRDRPSASQHGGQSQSSVGSGQLRDSRDSSVADNARSLSRAKGGKGAVTEPFLPAASGGGGGGGGGGVERAASVASGKSAGSTLSSHSSDQRLAVPLTTNNGESADA